MIVRIVLLCGLLTGAAAYAETLYVSDRLTLNLRDAPSSAAGVIRPSLSTGDAVEVLRRDGNSEFLEVVTEDGRQGWVHGQYLVATPIARERLQTAEERIAALERTIAEQRAEIEALTSGKPIGEPNDARAHEALEAQIDGLRRQLADLKDSLLRAIESRRADPPQGVMRALRDYWPALTAGLFIIGLIIGLIIKFRSKRSAWS